jgi:hypothetical protein
MEFFKVELLGVCAYILKLTQVHDAGEKKPGAR